MKRLHKVLIIAGLVVLLIIAVLFFGIGLYRQPNFIRNFEMLEYGADQPFVEPNSVIDGLAVYAIGTGETVLLFPYPHGRTTEPMAQSRIARTLEGMGRMVVTFDVPGAYRSTRGPVGDMEEMIRSADEALDRMGIIEPVDVVGHSMGGLAALAYTIERPERTQRLVLVTSLPGFPATARHGLPGSAFRIYEPDWWRIVIWGLRLNAGRGDLALHKKLQNLMEQASIHDKSFFSGVEIDEDDAGKGVPIHTIWSKNMYSGLSYADRLGDVQAETLILAGRHDPEAPLQCSEELHKGIPEFSLVVFEQSGHLPFIEQSSWFEYIMKTFLEGSVEGE